MSEKSREGEAGSRAEAPAILVVDDEEAVLRGIKLTLRSQGFDSVLTCAHGAKVAEILAEHSLSLILLDLMMPDITGLELLKELSTSHADIPVIVVTAQDDVATAVHCMKLGAADYLVKPVDSAALLASVRKALEQSALRYESSRLREQFFSEHLREPQTFAQIVTADPKMFRLFAYLEAISRSSQPVLITGETGSGKELVARALHDASQRNGPFVAVNAAGLDDAVFADCLFGHRTGAFTGADAKRNGMIEKAGDGSLFLDEIGDLSESSQVKLLRLIQEREYFPLGSDTALPVRARIIAATHHDACALREDLYYRFKAYHVHIPPLRERLGDLPLLVDHALQRAATDLGKSKPTVPGELFVYLSNYHFPGNVRELQAMVTDAVARHQQGVMALDTFLEHLGMSAGDDLSTRPSPSKERIDFPFPLPPMRDVEAAAFAEALLRVQGNQSAAARMLGVSRPTIARYLRKHD